MDDCDLLDEFCLEANLLSPLKEEGGFAGWMLEEKTEEESQEETMEVEQECFSVKRRHSHLL